jgi:pimeloyl-ACP methyl ester carboxylesterase
MFKFVLIHGAWHGGWCWEKVSRSLAAAGAAAYAPTLTGLGDRAHLLSRDTCLDTHVADVVDLLENERLTGVILVGHSYGGVVVTAVADRVPQRLSRLVYLDAAVPRNGQCLFDCTGPAFQARIEEGVRTLGDGWKIPVPGPKMLGLVEEDDLRWTMPRLVPHPYRTFREHVSLRQTGTAIPPRSYINCIGTKAPGGPRTAQAEGIDDYHELQTGHDAMVTAPRQVSELLLGIARAHGDK